MSSVTVSTDAVYAKSHSVSMPTRGIRARIVSDVKPHELVAALMHRDGIGPLPLAKKIRRPDLQSQIDRLRAGKVKNPTYGTIAPLAAHWKLPMEAFLDEKAATRVARELNLKPAPPRATRGTGRVNRVQAALDQIEKMTSTERRELERRLRASEKLEATGS